jgi:hypothetical protein
MAGFGISCVGYYVFIVELSFLKMSEITCIVTCISMNDRSMLLNSEIAKLFYIFYIDDFEQLRKYYCNIGLSLYCGLILVFLYMYCIPSHSHSTWCHYLNNTGWRVLHIRFCNSKVLMVMGWDQLRPYFNCMWLFFQHICSYPSYHRKFYCEYEKSWNFGAGKESFLAIGINFVEFLGVIREGLFFG